ncbi:MAG: response regulator transcription factor [Coriobacteriia bacterium]|nr:response regulator transcription factor [Coriobacteriia bacterium]
MKQTTDIRKRVLVIDDEESMAKIVRYSLEEADFEVAVAGDAEEASKLLGDFRPDVVVLDVMLPGKSGLEFCREARASSTVPIIMLSARGEEVDRILGLEFGADDYVVKPFSPRELVSRVRAHLRRAEIASSPGGASKISIGDLRIDSEAHQAYMDGAPVYLTTSEFQILSLLARHPGKVFSRHAILAALWGESPVGDERAVDVHVHNIREKIEPDPKEPEYLLTVRGVGYRLREP